jgi:hypothetical protein
MDPTLRKYHIKSAVIAIVFALIAGGALYWLDHMNLKNANGIWLCFLVVEFGLLLLYHRYFEETSR